MNTQHPEVHCFFDEATNAACYIVKDPASLSCAIIDSIWDFDLASGEAWVGMAITIRIMLRIETHEARLDEGTTAQHSSAQHRGDANESG